MMAQMYEKYQKKRGTNKFEITNRTYGATNKSHPWCYKQIAPMVLQTNRTYGAQMCCLGNVLYN
jgi:hypothetical protein